MSALITYNIRGGGAMVVDHDSNEIKM